MQRVGLIGVCVSACLWGHSTVVAAQGRVEIAAGRQLFHDSGFTMPKGFYLAGAGRIAPGLSVTGEIAGQSTQITYVPDVPELNGAALVYDLRLHTFLGGLRVAAKRGRVEPFGQVQAGAIRSAATGYVLGGSFLRGSNAGVNAALAAGGGVNTSLTPRSAVQLKVDYLRVVGDGGDNAVRVGAGMAVRF